MGMQVHAYDPVAGEMVGNLVDMSWATGVRLFALLGIPMNPETDALGGGECTVAKLRRGLERHPDGHPDPEIGQRMAGLLNLLLAAERHGSPSTAITWG